MLVKICDNKTEWENWQQKLGNSEFLQSWDWGKFQELAGFKVVRYQMWEADQVIAQFQGFEHNLSFFGTYLYLPRIGLQQSDFRLQDLVDYIKRQRYVFLRIESLSEIFEVRSPKSEVRNRQPQQTLVVDLTKTEIELLGEMHAKTRYNIHVAEKNGIEIRQEKNVEIFWQLNQETTNRDAFKSHSKAYYQKMLELPNIYQLTAYYQNQALASIILINYQNVLTYLHGASSNRERNLMAPYLLQWVGIKLGKNLNCKFYDFWGVAPQVEEGTGQTTCFHNFCWAANHRWTGVTRFKVGFGGNYKAYPQAVEIVFNNFKYKIFQFLKKIL